MNGGKESVVDVRYELRPGKNQVENRAVVGEVSVIGLKYESCG
jgi:hypothetical protein